MSDLIPVDPSEDDDGILRFVLDLKGGSVEPDVSPPYTGDYEELTNLPKINNITLIGNKTDEALGLQSKMDALTVAEINLLSGL